MKRWKIIFLLFLIIGTIFILRKQAPFHNDRGMVFGTVYSITYQADENLRAEIERELKMVDASLSTFNDTSVISRINKNEPVVIDSLFETVFQLSQQISKETHGAFDITVAPLVNVWGFGFTNKQSVDSATIDSILQFVGYNKVEYSNNTVNKADARTMLDCSAIAKGFGSDRVARLFDLKGIENYMVEIGGEVVVKGKNDKSEAWKIGVAKPTEDSLSTTSELQTILSVSNIGMATSGNYRNFYYKDGKRYAHTIDPQTGYPVQHSLLSATVLAPTCAQADALATAFMVMGVDAALAYCESHPDVEGYFIYNDEANTLKTIYTKGVEKLLSR